MRPLIVLAVSIAAIWTSVYFVKKAGDEYEKGLNDIKLNVGKRVVVNKDTLLIVDYSSLTEVYKLANGTDVSFEYIKQNKPF